MVVAMVDVTKAVVVTVVVIMFVVVEDIVVVPVVFCKVVVGIDDVVSSSAADDVKFGLERPFSRPRRISTRQNQSKLFEYTHMVQECSAKRWSSVLFLHLCMSMILGIHPPKLKGFLYIYITTA